MVSGGYNVDFWAELLNRLHRGDHSPLPKHGFLNLNSIVPSNGKPEDVIPSEAQSAESRNPRILPEPPQPSPAVSKNLSSPLSAQLRHSKEDRECRLDISNDLE
jgi:hypothetical protein